MTDPRPVLLLTRPEGAARRFLKQLDPVAMQNVDVVMSPLLRIEPTVSDLDLDAYKGLIFTSANGVSAVARATDRRDHVAYCVGPATTAAAQGAGWTAVQTGRTADDLVTALQKGQPDGPLLHLRGQHARGRIAHRLSQSGVTTAEQVVYAQLARPLSEAAVSALNSKRRVVIPLFSPRSANLFFESAPDRPMIVAAMSDAVAQEVPHTSQVEIHVADAPNAQRMGRLVEKLLQTSMSG